MDFCKKKKDLSEQDIKESQGEKWIWTAVDAPTRLIVCFLIGDRTMEDGKQFLSDLVSRLLGKPLFVSDELAHYKNCLLEQYHKLIKSKATGRPGRPRNPVKVIQDDLDYVTVHKTRENGRIVKVERKIVFGDADRIASRLESSPSHSINTSFVERTNLDWRLWDAHLSRKALTFARSFRWLNGKFAICVATYNFVRPHESLSRGPDRVFYPRTPAMAAGVTYRPWTIADLLGSRQICQ